MNMAYPSFERSDLLANIKGVVHGFFGRTGGVSRRAFSSLNCSFKVGDALSNVIKNRRLVMAALGLDSKPLFVPNLAHGNNVLVLEDLAFVKYAYAQEADAAVSTLDGVALGITHADCIPVLMASADGDIIAAVHAGWRGIRSRVIVDTIEKMKKLSPKTDIVAALGPGISQSGYVVTGEVLSYFRDHWPNFVDQNHDGGLINLALIALEQIKSSGVKKVQMIDQYTDLSGDRYFSYRMMAGSCGRQISVIFR